LPMELVYWDGCGFWQKVWIHGDCLGAQYMVFLFGFNFMFVMSCGLKFGLVSGDNL
jgi:hypothetical protein